MTSANQICKPIELSNNDTSISSIILMHELILLSSVERNVMDTKELADLDLREVGRKRALPHHPLLMAVASEDVLSSLSCFSPCPR